MGYLWSNVLDWPRSFPFDGDQTEGQKPPKQVRNEDGCNTGLQSMTMEVVRCLQAILQSSTAKDLQPNIK